MHWSRIVMRVQVSTMMRRLRDARKIVALSKIPIPHNEKKRNYFIWFIERKSFLYVNLSTKSMSSSGCSTWLLFNPSIDGCIHWSSGFAFRFRTGRRIQVLPGHLIWTNLAHILAQKIWTIYWPISNIVIKEKPMQSPKIPPQLAMNQIIGTWKRNKIF